LTLALFLAALPAVAEAATVSFRAESAGGPLVGRADVTLPATAVSPPGAAAGQACAGNSVIGALHAATGGDWSGTWADGDGWSINQIKGLADSANRRWAVYVNRQYLNAAPCLTQLVDGDAVLVYPFCTTTSTSQCFSGSPLEIESAPQAGPNGPLNLTVWEWATTFVNGVGYTQRRPAVSTPVSGPDGSATTDQYVGTAVLYFKHKGPNTIYTSGGGRVPDQKEICVTGGADGFCGTTALDPVPFDPAAFCETTGFDGLCGTPDGTPPVGQVTEPTQGKAYVKAGGPTTVSGKADFDASGVTEVNIHILRQVTVVTSRLKKRKVTIKKKVHGKVVRKRITKTRRIKVSKQVCMGWSAKKRDWITLSQCNSALAEPFKAEGGDTWTVDLPVPLPTGSYVLDAEALDGAGNLDSTPDLGRNHIVFKVG
jgi:hypothetical protein